MPIKYYVNKMTFAIKRGNQWFIGKLEITSSTKAVAYPNKKEIKKRLSKQYGEFIDSKILEQEKYFYFND